jgi:hypothetical protein
MTGDTTQVTQSMATMMAHPPPGMSASDVLDQIAERLARRGGGGDGGGPPHRKFLGMDLEKLWTKALMGLGAVIVWAFTWYMSVNQGLEARPTTVEVGDALKNAFTDHEAAPHPAKFQQVEADMRKISESQIRQEAYQEASAKALERLNAKLDGINITGANRRRP